VFWLVNLYSLFVYLEHNGDESPKGRWFVKLKEDVLTANLDVLSKNAYTFCNR